MHKKTVFASLAVALLVFPYALRMAGEHAVSVNAELVAAKGGQGGGNGGGQGNNGGGNGGGQGNHGGGNNGGGNGGGQGNHGGGNNGGGNGGGNGGDQGNSGGQSDQGGGTAGGNGGGGGSRGTIHGRGLRQHAAVLHYVLQRHGLHKQPARTYTYRHPSIHPAGFASHAEEEAWGEHLHDVTCSMYLYLRQLREARPRLRIDYVDWIVDQVAHATGEDRAEVKAALLGYPHHHDHTSALLRGISEVGCARSGRLPAHEQEELAEEHALHEHSVELSPQFSVADRSTGTGIVFQVMQSGAVFTDFGISHTKEMHLIIVRDDLRHFAHVHPEHDAAGTWVVPFAPPAGGTYWFFADFVDAGVTHYTLRFDRTYGGELGESGFAPSALRRKHAGEYMVILEETPYSDGILFTYHIDDDQGRAPFIEPYLGAMGHGILISPAGDFIHTHPSPAGDHLTLHLPNNLKGVYRMFTQFQIQSEVHTVEFDWNTEAAQ